MRTSQVMEPDKDRGVSFLHELVLPRTKSGLALSELYHLKFDFCAAQILLYTI